MDANGNSTGYPWSSGDVLLAADLNSAIANAGQIALGAAGAVIGAGTYGVVSDYQVLPGIVSWNGTTVTIAGANFSGVGVSGFNNPYLIMPAGGDDGHGNSVPAIVRIISASGTTATVDTAAAHPFSGLAATFGGPGLNPDNITITNAGTADVRVGDVLTAVGGDAIRPGTFYVSQTKVVSATVVAAGSGGAPGPVYLRGTTGHGRRVILLGTVQSDGTLASTLTVYDAGAYWQNIAALEATTPTTTEPMSAAPFATTVPGSWSAGGSVITISGLVHPTVLPYIHVGASVIAQADAGVGITAQSVVTAIDGTGRIVTISPAAVSAGTGQDVTFTDNLRPVSFAATFAASATTITATAALPASVTVGQAIYGPGLQGIGDPTNPNSTYIAAIDGTRTIITISVATTGATVAPVTIASVPYLQGVTVNLNFGAAVVAYKDWGAYRTLPGAGFSTTSVHTDGTASTATVTLTAAGSETSGVNFVHCGTDNSAALNAWLAAVRAAYGPYSNAGIEAVLPPGCYLTLGSVDATNICGGRGLNFKLAGAVIHSAIPATATGSAAYAWNAIGARFYRMEGQLFIRGNNWFPPDVGFIMGRITATQACDNMAMYDIQVSGHFRFAARMLGNVESSTAINCEGSNARPPLNALTPIYGTVFDGQNHWGKFPFTTDLGVTFKGITDINPIAICSGGGVPFLFNSTGWMYTLHGYAASWAMPTVFMGAAGAPYLDIHCETRALADALFIWHPSNPSSDFTGKFIDSSLNASNSLFSFDTEGRYGVPITAFSAEDATIEINPQVRSTELFDYAPALTAINWRGDIYVGSTGYTAATHYHNQANFTGRLMLGNTSTSYWSKNLTAKTIVATDQVVAVNNIQSQDGSVLASLGFGVTDGPGSLPFYANLGRGSLSLGTVGAPGTPGVVAPSVVFHGPGNTSATRTHQLIENTAGTLDIFGSGASNAYVRVNGTLEVTQPIILPPGSTGAFLPLTGGTVTGATTFSSTVQAGDTTIGTNAGTSARLTLNAPAGNATRNLRWQSGGVNRWSFGPTNNEAATVTTTTTGAVAAGSLVIPVTSAAGIVSGMQISVTGIPSTAYVSFVSGLNVTASTAATGGGIASGATVNFVPNTGADLFLNAINDSGGNWLTPLQITRSTGLLTLSNGLALNNNTMAPTSSTAYTPLLSINETLVGGVVPAGYQHANRININDVAAVGSDTDWTSGGFCGFSLFHNYGGTGFSGGRAAMNVQLAQTGASSFGPKIAGQFMVSANGNQGGTGTTLTTAKGSVYTLSTYARLLPGATNFYLINNEEKDIAVQAGASVAIKSSLTIAQLSNDAVQGSVVDAAFLIGSQAGAVGWLNGFAFGRPDGIWPMAAAATLVGTYRGGTKAMALAHGIDLRDVSFTGNAFASPGWSISGGGVMSLGGMVVTPADTSVAVDVVRSRVTATAIAGGGTAWVVGYAAYDAYGNQWTVSTIGAGGAVTGLTLVSRGYVTGATPANPVTITDQTGQLSATVNLTWATASTLALQPSGGTTTFGGSTNAGQPNFHAILSATQTLTSGVAAKILFNTKTFDSNNAYDNATNYRFTPQLAGKYRVTVNLLVNAAGTANSIQAALLYKNGVEFKRRQEMLANTNSFNNTEALTAIISMNGTTDYLEGWGVVTGTTATVQGGAAYSFFEAQYIGA